MDSKAIAWNRHRTTARSLAAAAVVAAGGLAGVAAGVGPATGATAASPNAGVVAAIGDVNTDLGYENASAAGTGMVLTAAGEVITNNHVIRGATKISVRDVGNGRTYPATVLGYDIGEDVALLALKGAAGLRTIRVANSSSVRVGAKVTVIGNAGGRGGTPTSATGRVLALGQSITASDESNGTSEELRGLIETSAAVEPGDSGGALVNASGAVVGLVTAASSGFELQPGGNVGFAVPMNKAMAVVRKIERRQFTGGVHPGATAFLGVSVVASDYVRAGAVASGVLVVGVVPGSPAERAGVVAGDVVTAVAGKATRTPTALTDALLARRPGGKVHLSFVDRLGTAHQAVVTLIAGPPQ